MRYKQLSIRLPLSSYNRIQKQAVVENVSMNNVFNMLLDEHMKTEDVVVEVRRVSQLLAEILLLAFPEERRPEINKLKAMIQEVQNGSQV